MDDLAQVLGRISQSAVADGFRETDLPATGRAPLLLLQREGETAAAPRIYLSAGIHGDEPAGVAAMELGFAEGLFASDFHWTLFPALNPGGLSRGTREGLDGLDLNRDYARRQTAEVATHAGWLDQQGPFDLAVCLHEDWEASGFYLYEKPAEGSMPLGPGVVEALDRIGLSIERAGTIDGHPAEGGVIYPSHPRLEDDRVADPSHPLLREGDVPEALLLWERHHAHLFTLETPSSLPREKRCRMHLTALRFLLSVFRYGRES